MTDDTWTSCATRTSISRHDGEIVCFKGQGRRPRATHLMQTAWQQPRSQSFGGNARPPGSNGIIRHVGQVAHDLPAHGCIRVKQPSHHCALPHGRFIASESRHFSPTHSAVEPRFRSQRVGFRRAGSYNRCRPEPCRSRLPRTQKSSTTRPGRDLRRSPYVIEPAGSAARPGW